MLSVKSQPYRPRLLSHLVIRVCALTPFNSTLQTDITRPQGDALRCSALLDELNASASCARFLAIMVAAEGVVQFLSAKPRTSCSFDLFSNAPNPKHKAIRAAMEACRALTGDTMETLAAAINEELAKMSGHHALSGLQIKVGNNGYCTVTVSR